MEQVYNGDLLTVVFGNLALGVVDLYIVVNAEDMDLASLAEKDFCLGGVCRVGLVVHGQALDHEVVLDGKDKESWSLVALDPVWHRKTQSNKRILRSARTLGQIDLLPNLVRVWLNPVGLHWCTTEQHE